MARVIDLRIGVSFSICEDNSTSWRRDHTVMRGGHTMTIKVELFWLARSDIE